MADINLTDVARGLKDEVVKGIVLQFARQSQVMQRIPFVDVDSFWLKVHELQSLSEANFRKIGSAFAEVKDNIRELQEGIFLLGGQIDIDTALRLPGQKDVDVYAENLSWQSERFRHTFMDKFFNGNRNTDPDEFDGLRKRVTDLVSAGHSEARVNGASSDSLDLTTSANRQTFLDKINEAMFNVADGIEGVNIMVTGREGYLSIESVARREGLLDTTRDMFDRKINTFGGVPFTFAGTKANQTTQIITKTEDPGDAGNDSTSFYMIRFGRPYLTGIQMGGPKRLFDDITDDGVTHRVVFQWPLGLAAFHERSFVRLTNVKPLF